MKTNRRKLKGWVFGAIVVVALAALILVSYSPQPIYNGQPIGYWFDQLGGTNRGVAVDALKHVDEEAVPFLVSRARDRDTRLDRLYAGMWARLPKASRSELPDPNVTAGQRLMALYLLEELGPRAKAAVPELFDALDSSNAFFSATPPNAIKSRRQLVAEAIFSIDGGNPATVRALFDRATVEDDKATPRILVLVSGSNLAREDLVFFKKVVHRMHAYCVQELPLLANSIAPDTPLDVERLLAIAAPPPPDLDGTRVVSVHGARAVAAAAASLSRATHSFDRIVPGLIDALGERTGAVFHPYDTPEPPDWGWVRLVDMMEPREVSQHPAWTLAQLHARSDLPLPSLIRKLEECDDPHEAAAVAGALFYIGEDAKPALEALRRLHSARNDMLRYHAAKAIWSIAKDGRPLLPFELQALQVPDRGYEKERQTVTFLGAHGVGDPAALAALRRVILPGAGFRYQATAINALGSWGPSAEPALPEIRMALTNEWFTVRDAATNALQKIEAARQQ